MQVSVSIHAPAWGATNLEDHFTATFQVSIHAPAWGATGGVGALQLADDVSIHAPAWGATLLANETRINRRFQSTRPRGARLCFGQGYQRLKLGFNPRARVGRDKIRIIARLIFCVSIHAPAWGATILNIIIMDTDLFQSTRPRGARLSCKTHFYEKWSFNPRARVGRDKVAAETNGVITEFQSTRPRGARPTARATTSTLPTFQSTRPRGARQWLVNKLTGASDVSIHAPAWGATLLILPLVAICLFQSTRPRGARPNG